MKKLYILFTFIVCANILKAQIVYYEYENPKPIVYNSSLGSALYSIDLNLDSINDFIFMIHYQPFLGCSVKDYESIRLVSLNTNKILLNDSANIVFNNFDSVINMPANYPCETILSSELLCNYHLVGKYTIYNLINYQCVFSHYKYVGLTNSIPSFFIGIKFKIGENFHYGWIKATKNENLDLKIISYAYNTQPNQFLKIEDPNPSSGIKNKEVSSFKIYPNPTDGILKIESPEKIERIIVRDIIGRIVKTSTETELNLTDFESGNYILQIQTADKISTQKLLIKK